MGPGDQSFQAIATVHRDDRDSEAITQDEVVIGTDVDAGVSVGAEHVVEQEAGLLAKVAAVTLVKDQTRGFEHGPMIGSPRAAPVAQRIERGRPKACVGGSIPSGGAFTSGPVDRGWTDVPRSQPDHWATHGTEAARVATQPQCS